MKNIRHIKNGDSLDNRMAISNHQVKVSRSKLSSGSVADKFPLGFIEPSDSIITNQDGQKVNSNFHTVYTD